MSEIYKKILFLYLHLVYIYLFNHVQQINWKLTILLDIEGQDLSPTCMSILTFNKTCVRFGPPNIQGNDRVNTSFTCRSLPQTGTAQTPIEPCTPPSTYSYFWGSELSFLINTGIECGGKAIFKRRLFAAIKFPQKYDLIWVEINQIHCKKNYT